MKGGIKVKIRKAIIPAAGLGTRFLPATKSLPKEMLPIVDKPTIQYIVEEAIASGIEDILIISGRNKRMIEDHFDKSYELEEILSQKNKTSLLKEVQSISNLANIHYIRQKEAKGLGDAIYCARTFIGNEPFAVLLGDDIITAEKPCLQQLIEVYDKNQTSVVGVQPVPKEQVSQYGIIKLKNHQLEDHTLPVEDLVEKPSPHEAPSNYALMGRYILQPAIFDILSNLPPGQNEEIQLTDAINVLSQSESVYACVFNGVRYDIGNKMGFIKATLDFAMERPEFRKEVLSYLKEVMDRDDTS